MTDITCAFAGDREQALIAYLYDDIDPVERAAFDAHLPTCARCRRDLAALGGVRQRLTEWHPPMPNLSALGSPSSAPAVGVGHPSTSTSSSPWRHLPAWAQVAAALLFLGVSAGIANLDVRYDANGVSIRTGWSPRANRENAADRANPQQNAANVASPANPANLATHDQLTALEQQLRNEIKMATATTAAAPPRSLSASDAETLRRVRALIDESEKREQRELALRVAQVLRDVNAQRQADLSKIDRNLGLIQNSTGVEILKQREMVNYLMRVSQRQ